MIDWKLSKRVMGLRVDRDAARQREDRESMMLDSEKLPGSQVVAVGDRVDGAVSHAPAAVPLAVIEERLASVQRENEYLKAFNQQLVAALADASRNGAEANHLANHDALTGLPNRLMLLRRLQDSIADAFRRQTQLSLMFIDLDGFKIINDRFGHEMGDKLLTVVASRISSCVRADDLACRYGGDEFVVMLSNVGNASIAVAIAEEIRARIEGRYSIDGHEVHVSASVGLANFPADGAYPAALLSSADASMYRGKASRSREGRGAVEPALTAQGA